MTISETIRQGLHYARTCRSLWLFGFFVGMTSGGSSGGGGGADGGSPFALSVTEVTLAVSVLVLAVAAVIVMRFISEGALIEGIVRARRGGRMTTREGFRVGWAHWGVLLRIGLLYLAALVVSLALLTAPCVIALHAYGPVGGVALSVPALFVGIPWLITLHLVQAFASRIAVLENRRALDAIGKSRLFLHGRLMHGLKLIVATFAGTLVIALLAIVVMTPVVLLMLALMPSLGVPAVVLGCIVLLPAIYVLSAMAGTLRSSIWTIGYVTQVES